MVTVVALAITVTTLSGCANVRGNGPLKLGGEAGQLCVPAGPDELVGVGEVLTTDTAAPLLAIESVVVEGAESLHTSGIYLVPAPTGDTLMSMYVADPPPGWGKKVDAIGAEIKPGNTVNLVAVIARTGPENGHASSVEVIYRDESGIKYVARSTTSILLADSCD